MSDEPQPAPYAMRFSLAGRIAILCAVPIGVLVFVLVSNDLLNDGMSFPIFIPGAIGIGAALLWVGMARLILPRIGIPFWSKEELARREKDEDR